MDRIIREALDRKPICVDVEGPSIACQVWKLCRGLTNHLVKTGRGGYLAMCEDCQSRMGHSHD